jgi:hypothetical protein
MTELALEMQRRGRFSRRLVTPEPREIRYRIMRPFRRALRGVVDKKDIESLVETIPGAGLRPQCASAVLPRGRRAGVMLPVTGRCRRAEPTSAPP